MSARLQYAKKKCWRYASYYNHSFTESCRTHKGKREDEDGAERVTFMHNSKNEHEAMMKAELDISKEYHIALFDIKKLVRA